MASKKFAAHVPFGSRLILKVTVHTPREEYWHWLVRLVEYVDDPPRVVEFHLADGVASSEIDARLAATGAMRRMSHQLHKLADATDTP